MVCYELYVWGTNGHGQLGLGHDRENETTTPVKYDLNDVDVSRIEQIVGGGAHTMLLTDGGKLYACGRNSKGQLGLGGVDKANVCRFRPVPVEWSIKTVACGWDHTLAITNDGSVIGCGCNRFGQLGSLDGRQQISTFTKIEGIVGKVRNVAAGLRHSAAVTDDGRIWTWGSNRKGQLGRKTSTATGSVEIVESLNNRKVMEVACGEFHTAVVTDRGEMHLFGMCDFQSKSDSTCRNDFFDGSKISLLRSGWSHLLVMTICGKIYTWGRNDYSQLGRSTCDNYDSIPGVVNDVPNVIKVCVGSEHNVIVRSTDEGDELLTWGWNEHGICGTGNEVNVSKPTRLLFKRNWRLKALGCGSGHTFTVIRIDTV